MEAIALVAEPLPAGITRPDVVQDTTVFSANWKPMRLTMKHFLRATLCICLLAGLSSCATILGGRSNTLVFESPNSQQADVFLDGEKVGQAPGKIKLPARKIQHGSRLSINAEGFRAEEYVILRRPDPVYVVADVISSIPTIGIALIVDFSDGQVYRPRPRKFVYELEKDQ